MFYQLGHMPLELRVQRYADSHIDATHIPIHPTEFWELLDSKTGIQRKKLMEQEHGLPIVPLGDVELGLQLASDSE